MLRGAARQVWPIAGARVVAASCGVTAAPAWKTSLPCARPSGAPCGCRYHVGVSGNDPQL